ncbi:MAG: Nif11-like leader peptide family natural product precursor [Desmonostoc vinosum HA7617-LM4]|jgi:predicted ribosomally synthesized peptide with nif11-like leader|nr:Nif11-like leader peptide family natural product precursor [Desmonostoc vinosum HA7617-LM4]
MSLENVQAFYARLANDEAFRTQMQEVTTKEECSQVVKSAGYDFTQAEFEQYTTQVLESISGEGELKDLDEKELEAVFGGASSILGRPDIRPLYGVVIWPPIKWPPIGPQPLYGIVQPMYGIVRSDDLA